MMSSSGPLLCSLTPDDMRRLIAEVRARPYLWDYQSSDYNDVNKGRQAWTTISHRLGRCSPNDWNLLWNGKRNYYCSLKRAGTLKNTWPYARLLSFLDGVNGTHVPSPTTSTSSLNSVPMVGNSVDLSVGQMAAMGQLASIGHRQSVGHNMSSLGQILSVGQAHTMGQMNSAGQMNSGGQMTVGQLLNHQKTRRQSSTSPFTQAPTRNNNVHSGQTERETGAAVGRATDEDEAFGRFVAVTLAKVANEKTKRKAMLQIHRVLVDVLDE